MEESLSRVALVTGGTTALGQASALELARRGWSVVLQHAEGEDAQAALGELKAAAGAEGRQIEAAARQADLGNSAGREQLVEYVLETFERIDMLLNAATTPPTTGEDLLEMNEDSLRGAIDATLTGTFFLTQLVAREMVRLVEAGQIENPRIVTINSIGAYTTSADHGPQCLSRSALAMITRLFADRLGEHGINVYEIRAGIVKTSHSDSAYTQYDELIQQGLTPLRRWGRPRDVARAVAAIAEDLLDFSTGEVLNVDGGFHLRRL